MGLLETDKILKYQPHLNLKPLQSTFLKQLILPIDLKKITGTEISIKKYRLKFGVPV